jgi:hypothetical protein
MSTTTNAATATPGSAAGAVPRPDLNGYLLQVPGGTAIYWVDGGLLRWIPDLQTLQNLFGTSPTVTPDIDLVQIAGGTQVTSGAILAGSDSAPAIYLIDNGTKRWIASGDAMRRYNFDQAQAIGVLAILLDFIPSGPDLT